MSQYERKNQYVEIQLYKVFRNIPYVGYTEDEGYIVSPLSMIDDSQKKSIYKKTIKSIMKSEFYKFFIDGKIKTNHFSHNGNSKRSMLAISMEKDYELNLDDFNSYNFKDKIRININGLIVLMIYLSSYSFIHSKGKANLVDRFNKYMEVDYNAARIIGELPEHSSSTPEFEKYAESYEKFYDPANYDRSNFELMECYIDNKTKGTIFPDKKRSLEIQSYENKLVFFFLDFLFFVFDEKNVKSLFVNSKNSFLTFICNTLNNLTEDPDIDVTNNFFRESDSIEKLIENLTETNVAVKGYSSKIKLNLFKLNEIESVIWDKEAYTQCFYQICRVKYNPKYDRECEEIRKKNNIIIEEIVDKMFTLSLYQDSAVNLGYQKKLNVALRELQDTISDISLDEKLLNGKTVSNLGNTIKSFLKM